MKPDVNNSSDAPKNWYLAQLKPNCAKIADRNLIQQGFDTFLPEINQTVKRAGRFVTQFKPLFPGYIFVALTPSSSPWQAVNSTHGITKLVSFGKAPSVVPHGLVAELRAYSALKNNKILDETPSQARHFKAGDRVQLTTGPFADTIAEIDTVQADRRIWVLMDILGKETRVALDRSEIRVA